MWLPQKTNGCKQRGHRVDRQIGKIVHQSTWSAGHESTRIRCTEQSTTLPHDRPSAHFPSFIRAAHSLSAQQHLHLMVESSLQAHGAEIRDSSIAIASILTSANLEAIVSRIKPHPPQEGPRPSPCSGCNGSYLASRVHNPKDRSSRLALPCSLSLLSNEPLSCMCSADYEQTPASAPHCRTVEKAFRRRQRSLRGLRIYLRSVQSQQVQFIQTSR